jgi:cytochrome c-type biogenesis protein
MIAAAAINSLSPAAVVLAALAGAVSFASPCVLPLVPVFLSYVSGVAVADLDRRRREVVGAALAFCAGFTAVFVAWGAAAGAAGSLLTDERRLLTVVGGVFLVLAGLAVADVLPLPGLRLSPSPRAGAIGAFVTGAVVCLGWTPCVGYVLGGILVLAGAGGSAASGALLLAVYSAGLAVPFVLTALAYDWAIVRLGVLKRHHRTVRIMSGVVLAAFGLLLVTGTLTEVTRRLPEVRFFDL